MKVFADYQVVYFLKVGFLGGPLQQILDEVPVLGRQS
ncbi:hypothetical protein BN8_00064 [Fibrisoma limi BUZ 3]|uniref:Uncharacterized protein n=1 Tax=Fibrisoma limi BUZ 3 TaxID=1185876 RepID=I2GB79_9BACT|nr:hypothetical protein BN8_00064 [Fibrisoma limi BUZ 3]